jgi:glyceraldehyde 3-phosphate dehydrogenase
VTTRIGINGFGRIGRNYFRAALAQGADLEIVAVNDLTSPEALAHLLKYDSVGGRLAETIEVKEGNLVVNGNAIKVLAERDPANLPGRTWALTLSSSPPVSSPRQLPPRSTSRPAPRRS